MKKRVFMVHGWQGTPDTHFKPWLKSELQNAGFEVSSPQMPNPIFPNLNEWIETIKYEVGEVDKNTYFIGHSLGCIAIVRFLASLSEGLSGGAVFIAGFARDLGIEEIKDFYSEDAEIEKAISHSKKIVVILSDNDKDVPLEIGLHFQKTLQAELILEHGKGHFCEEDGVTTLPSALEAILKMSAETEQAEKEI